MNDNQIHAEQLPPGMTREIWDTLAPDVQAALTEAGAPDADVVIRQSAARAFESRFRSNLDKNGGEGSEVEIIIEREDLITKIQGAATDGPISLWTLFEDLAEPLTILQQAVLYAVEELYGRGSIELGSPHDYTELVTAYCDVAPAGSPAWFRRQRTA